MARPRIEISQKEFEKLCGLQCTLGEIAAWFGCSDDTIERWCQRTYKQDFAEVFAAKRGLGKISLRRMQWQLAQKSAIMAIFLGKNYLGQSDQPDARDAHDVEDLAPLADMLTEDLTEGLERPEEASTHE